MTTESNNDKVRIAIQQIGPNDYIGYVFYGTPQERVIAREKTEALCKACTIARAAHIVGLEDNTEE